MAASTPGAAGPSWHREPMPVWDQDKQRVIGGAPEGIFHLPFTAGAPVPGEWFVAIDGDAVVGYGWLDVAWGDAEILLAVDPQRQRQGIGAFVLDRIEAEAAERGVNYVYNVVSPRHPQRDQVQGWLKSHGFIGDDSGPTLRKRVRRGTPATGEAGAPGRNLRTQDPLREHAGGPGHEPAAGVDRGHAGDPKTAAEGAPPSRRVQHPQLNVPTFDAGRDLPPGREDSGGYVDPESHQY